MLIDSTVQPFNVPFDPNEHTPPPESNSASPLVIMLTPKYFVGSRVAVGVKVLVGVAGILLEVAVTGLRVRVGARVGSGSSNGDSQASAASAIALIRIVRAKKVEGDLIE
jgi:hypothetical protein